MPRLGDSTFVIVGVGGLGSPLAMTLATLGAGRLVLVDDDVVDLSNLQRQILYRTEDVGRPKVLAARDSLVRLGADPARIEPVNARFDDESARALAHDATVLLEGSDDLATKFRANDVACALGRPVVVGAALRSSGQVFPVRPGRDACYRCLFEELPEDEPPSCGEAGILGATCGLVAALMARAAVALVTGEDPAGVLGRFWLLERGQRRAIQVNPRRGCLACGQRIEVTHAS